MKRPGNILTVLLRTGKWFLGALLALSLLSILFQYVVMPVYRFPVPLAFHGEKFFNPYQDVDSTAWKKACFQVHSESWGGLSEGKGKVSEIFDLYRYLGYDLVCMSDYQKINDQLYTDSCSIHNYEHGFGMKKNHQLNIGARSVSWFDFLLPQTKSNKQYIIDRLKKNSPVLALAHPAWSNAYTKADMQYLTGYDVIEVASKFVNSAELWDAALSAGHPVFCIADDDGHDINNPNDFGRCLTLVNAKHIDSSSVIAAIQQGKTIGVRMCFYQHDTYETKKKRFDAMPMLRYFHVDGDTIKLSVKGGPCIIKFIGQDGVMQEATSVQDPAKYVIKSSDTYIRTEIHFNDESVWYLNPVIRYNGNKLPSPKAAISEPVSGLKNFGLAFVITLGLWIYRKKSKVKS